MKKIDAKNKISEFMEYLKKLDTTQKQELAEKLQAFSIAGKTYSATNTCLLAYQQAPKGVFGGFNQWKQAGRTVKKGEKSFKIFFPAKPKKNKERDGENENARPLHFFLASVFHESQTESQQAA